MNDTEKSDALAEAPRTGRFTLGEIAQFDPNLAATLLECGKVGVGGVIDTGGWEMLSFVGRFTSLAANQMVEGEKNGIVTSDLWVREVKYTVRRPHAFAGSVFKAQSDYYNAKNPNIDFQLTVNSYCRYLISPDFSPLENIESVFQRVTPIGLVLRCSANIVARFTNLRALADDENPTEAIITFHGVRLPSDYYGRCNAEQSRAMLRELRYLP